MNPREDPKANVVLYMRIDPLKILTESRLVVLAELLLSIVQLFGAVNRSSIHDSGEGWEPLGERPTYGWVALDDGDTKWLALFELPRGYKGGALSPDDIKPNLPKGPIPRPRNGFSEDDLV